MDKHNPFEVTARAPPEFHSVPPAVAGSISDLDSNMNALRMQEKKANDAHQHFMAAASNAQEHVNDGREYRFKVAYKIAELKGEAHFIEKLKQQQLHLKTSRDALDKKIRLVMEPKLKFAKGRLTIQRESLEDKVKAFDFLNASHQKWKEKTIDTLGQKKRVHRMLKAANKELADAQKEQKDTAIQYNGWKKEAAEQVQEYQYVVTKFKAARTETEEAEEQTKKVKHAYKRIHHIFSLEEKKLQAAYAAGETRLDNKILRAEKRLTKKQHKLKEEKKKFVEWREDQYDKSKVKAEKKMEYDNSLKAYAKKRKKTLEAAWEHAGKRAEAHYGDGENDWAYHDWSGPDADEAEMTDTANTDCLTVTPPPGGFANDVDHEEFTTDDGPASPPGMGGGVDDAAAGLAADAAGVVDTDGNAAVAN
jgi:hypothetical protein